MSIGIFALLLVIPLGALCLISRPQDKASVHVDCRPIHTVKSVDIPKELLI